MGIATVKAEAPPPPPLIQCLILKHDMKSLLHQLQVDNSE